MKNLKLLASEFSTQVNSNGYQILFRGQPIGGAGTIPINYKKAKRNGKREAKDRQDYQFMAQREIENLLSGGGTKWMRDEIDKIVSGAKIKERLEYLRAELRAERISYDELNELQQLAEHIDAGDVELLEAAGVPEHK